MICKQITFNFYKLKIQTKAQEYGYRNANLKMANQIREYVLIWNELTFSCYWHCLFLFRTWLHSVKYLINYIFYALSELKDYLLCHLWRLIYNPIRWAQGRCTHWYLTVYRIRKKKNKSFYVLSYLISFVLS